MDRVQAILDANRDAIQRTLWSVLASVITCAFILINEVYSFTEAEYRVAIVEKQARRNVLLQCLEHLGSLSPLFSGQTASGSRTNDPLSKDCQELLKDPDYNEYAVLLQGLNLASVRPEQIPKAQREAIRKTYAELRQIDLKTEASLKNSGWSTPFLPFLRTSVGDADFLLFSFIMLAIFIGAVAVNARTMAATLRAIRQDLEPEAGQPSLPQAGQNLMHIASLTNPFPHELGKRWITYGIIVVLPIVTTVFAIAFDYTNIRWFYFHEIMHVGMDNAFADNVLMIVRLLLLTAEGVGIIFLALLCGTIFQKINNTLAPR